MPDLWRMGCASANVLESTNAYTKTTVVSFRLFVLRFGFRQVMPVLLNARLFCDAVVSRLNFLVEDFEGALTNRAVLT